MRSFLFFMMSLLTVLSFANSTEVVVVETNRGSFEIELNPEKAPLSVDNFLKYVDSKFYDGTIVHRVVNNFVVQAGGLNIDLVEKPTLSPIKNEAANGLSNTQGTVAMARTSEVDSATSHFFINLKDNLFLDYVSPEKYGYAVFGKVTSGWSVVEAMQLEAVHTVGEYEDVPVTPIIIQSVHRK